MDNYKLTKLDIAAIRNADDIVVHLSKQMARAALVKRIRHDEKHPFAQDAYHEIPCPIVMHGHFLGGQRDNDIKNGDIACFAMASIYYNQTTPLSSALKTLHVGDEIRFRFAPDYETNQYMFEAGLHGDVLFLDVYRNGKYAAQWEICDSECPENTARMCKGVPYAEHWFKRSA